MKVSWAEATCGLETQVEMLEVCFAWRAAGKEAQLQMAGGGV